MCTSFSSQPARAQDQEDERRKNWASIGEAKSSSEDDRQHTAGGGDNSIHALREKNRCTSHELMLVL